MRSVNCLQVYLWVPVRVKNDNDVCLVQVNSDSSGSCRQNEDLFVTLWVLEVVDSRISVLCRCLAIDPAVFIASDSKHVVKDVH